jgi:hypothetical protein
MIHSLCYTYGFDQQRIFMEEHVGAWGNHIYKKVNTTR